MINYWHMVNRTFWKKLIEEAWNRRSVIWLAGIRRVGKTCLCKSLPNIEYFDCELPRIRKIFEDPEDFLRNQQGKRIVLDEIHRLNNPSEILKIAADHYPNVKIIATGSSTLGATAKFKDTLTGRKEKIWLTPMLLEETGLFGYPDILHRFSHGGLPPFFMVPDFPERNFQEWIDAYWAKDIQELFRLEKRYSFQKFLELLLSQSGSIFEATRFAVPCEASRSTISNYLSALEATFVVHIIRPFSTHRTTEIVAAPKVYGFDTGFICHSRGWLKLRREDFGLLWEHCVLNEIQGKLQVRSLNYWRDKRGHEIDFIYPKSRGRAPIAIECKWNSKNFDPLNLQVFRKQYPEGKNFVVAHDIDISFKKRFDGVSVSFVNLKQLIDVLRE